MPRIFGKHDQTVTFGDVLIVAVLELAYTHARYCTSRIVS